MEGFKYIDIFATKGIEYIVAIVFLIMLVLFWKWINHTSVKPVVSGEKIPRRVSLVDWFHLVNDYYYHQGHTWIFPENKNIVHVGIDDFAQKLIGQATDILLPERGARIKQGEKTIKVKVDGKWIDFLAPVDGEVIAINEKVIDSPQIINQDPYDKGWLIRVNTDRLTANLSNLLNGKIARAWIEETVNKISRIMTGNSDVIIQDGGTISNGFIKELAPDHWEEVAADLFLTKDM